MQQRITEKDLGMVEQRMYSLLKGDPSMLAELTSFATSHTTTELVNELHRRYPSYADFITRDRVERVWSVIEGHGSSDQASEKTAPQGKQAKEEPLQKDQTTGEHPFTPDPLAEKLHRDNARAQSRQGDGFFSWAKKTFGPKDRPQEDQGQYQYAGQPGQTGPASDQALGEPPREKTAMEKMRDKVSEFDEDYKDIGERVLGGFTQFIGYIGPFMLMAWIGADLGQFFTSTMNSVSAYGLSFTIEGIIAACTVAMGRAFAEIAGGKANFGKTLAVFMIWLILNASSAFALYLVITHNNDVDQGSIEQLSMVIRVVAIALGDLGCSAVLMFKGRSLQKHIESIRKKATAIGELADAQRGIEEADKNAALRDQMMKSTLKIQEELSEKIGEAVSMVMENIVTKMEKALKDDDGKSERGYGRR
jgi:hypothetical protein